MELNCSGWLLAVSMYNSYVTAVCDICLQEDAATAAILS
jgi:hypothetical protein